MKSRRGILVVSLLMSLVTPAFSGNIEESWRARIEAGDARRATDWGRDEQKPLQLGKGGLEEIGLERTSFMAHGGSEIVIQADGHFRSIRETATGQPVRLVGKVDLQALANLAAFVQDSAFLALEDEYTSGATDQSAAYTAVTWNGRRKIVRNYDNTGPRKLWVLEQLVEKIVADAESQPAPATQPTTSPTHPAARPASGLPAASKSEARAALIKNNARSVELLIAYVGEQDKPYYHLRLAVPFINDPAQKAFDLREQIDDKQVTRIVDALAKDGFLDRATDHLLRIEGPGYHLKLTLDTAMGPAVFHEDLGFNLAMLRHLDALLPALDEPGRAKLQTLLNRLAGEREIWERFEKPRKTR